MKTFLSKTAKANKSKSAICQANNNWKRDTFSLSAIVKYIERNIESDPSLAKAIKPKSKEAFLNNGFAHIKSQLKESEQTKKQFTLYTAICIINRYEKK